MVDSKRTALLAVTHRFMAPGAGSGDLNPVEANKIRAKLEKKCALRYLLQDTAKPFQSSHVADAGGLRLDTQFNGDFLIRQFLKVPQGENFLIRFAHAIERLSHFVDQLTLDGDLTWRCHMRDKTLGKAK